MGYIGQTPSAVPLDGDDIADDIIDSQHYAAGSIDTAHLADDQITLAKMAAGTDGNIISYDASGNPVAIATGSDGQVLTSAGAGQPCAFETLTTGKIVQVVNAQSSSVATGTTVVSRNGSITQITEGDEYMTLAITPTNASNKLLVQVVLLLGSSATQGITACLFNTDIHSSNALAAMTEVNGSADWELSLSLNYFVAAGTTDATTFRVRAGGDSSSTTTFNGVSTAVLHGAAIKSSMTIMEIAV
jgi:hypothetical protein